MRLVTQANELYDKMFANDEFCLVHGDMHRYNIMKSGELITAIDPIGYIAPLELDIVRFIGTYRHNRRCAKEKSRACGILCSAFIKGEDRIAPVC